MRKSEKGKKNSYTSECKVPIFRIGKQLTAVEIRYVVASGSVIVWKGV